MGHRSGDRNERRTLPRAASPHRGGPGLITSPSPRPNPPHHDVHGAPLLDIPAVARRLDVCEKTVRRFIARGELNAYRIGRQHRVSEEGLLRFLELRK